MAFGKKVYGNSKTDLCPFCGSATYFKNKVGISVCKDHKDTEYPAIKCRCGSWLEVLSGKFGTYCNCLRCGNISLAKALAQEKEMKYSGQKLNNVKPLTDLEKKCKETGIRSWKEI